MNNCPLCNYSAFVLVESENVRIIRSPWNPDVPLVTLKRHSEELSQDEYREAIELARKEYSNAMFGDCNEVSGHWAAKIIKMDKVGSSRMYKEKS